MKKPNVVQTMAAVAACKATRAVLRKTGRGGTAIPGIVALKLSKNILSVPAAGMKIVVVTGTNGKTTTCNMVAHAIEEAGFSCLLNKSGANLLHGIASDLVCNADWRGRPRHEYAVLECDEAALKQVVPLIRPRAIVVTNLFSDQVDRYGGVQNTLAEIRAGVELSPKSVLVLNADDPLSASLSIGTQNKVVWYGMEKSVLEGPGDVPNDIANACTPPAHTDAKPSPGDIDLRDAGANACTPPAHSTTARASLGDIDLRDAGVCPKCGGDFEYAYHVYAHLGGYRCGKCGWKRPNPQVGVISLDEMGTGGSRIHMRAFRDANPQDVRIALPAVYNVYNAAASIAAAKALRLPLQDAIEALATVQSAFGRLETFDLHGIRLQMILVKNPAGCNQAFSYVAGTGEDYTAVLCLNDRTGDGHDISWIEDADYEKLLADPHLQKIYVAGDRAQDLFARLQKAQGRAASRAKASAPASPADSAVPAVPADSAESADSALSAPSVPMEDPVPSGIQMEIVADYAEIVRRLAEDGRTAFLLPNYTAMMELRAALGPETGNKDFWK